MGFFDNVKQESSFSEASGATGLNYVVLQVTLKYLCALNGMIT